MKHVFFLVLAGFTASFLVSYAEGLIIPLSPEELFEQSQTIFVGKITSSNVLEFEKSSTSYVDKNGTDVPVIENYTLSLDQYTIDIEEFLKNPQNYTTIKVLQPTTSVPGRIIPYGGFEVGERVLMYLEKIDDKNTYSVESFSIPEYCDAQSVLFSPRFSFGNDFRITQNGIQREDNFTTGIPIQFVYEKDSRTLSEKEYNFTVNIIKKIDKGTESVLSKKIIAKSKPCEWIASAKWEITPTAGKHIMTIQIIEDGGGSGHSSSFTVRENEDYFSEKNVQIEFEDFEFEMIDDYGIFTENMKMAGILEAERQYYVIQKVEFEQKDLPDDNTQVKGTVGFAFQYGDKMLRPPMDEGVTQEEGLEFSKKMQQYQIEFRNESMIGDSYEFVVDVKKPFYIKFPIQINQSGQYTFQFYKTTDLLQGPSGVGMGGLVVVEKYSKAVNDTSDCKTKDFVRVIKHDYSTIACTTVETFFELQERGWALK